MKKIKDYLSGYQIIALLFLGLILLGACLLSLPISAADGSSTPFINSLFTSTSAVCVTGLVIYDTFTHWSLFGKIIILMLIQVGALSLMTIVTLCTVLAGKKIGIYERKLAAQSSGSMSVGQTISLTRQIVFGSLCAEAIGAVLLSIRFCRQFGFLTGTGLAIFHSISAFCNAGFDLFGRFGEYSSLMPYAEDFLVNIVIMVLITVGGIGFAVWVDVRKYKWQLSRYSLHSKIAVFSSFLLVLLGFICMFILEYNNQLAALPFPKKALAALFLSVSPRTAGFNTLPVGELTDSSKLLTSILMIIGGSPGSTAGGMKTTTVAVMIICTLSAARGIDNTEVFRRRLTTDTIHQAIAVCTIYASALLTGTLLICGTQHFAVIDGMFEVASAAGTVGLTTGITPQLNTFSKLIIMFMMYAGRVGILTFAMAIAQKRKKIPITRPTEKVMLG